MSKIESIQNLVELVLLFMVSEVNNEDFQIFIHSPFLASLASEIRLSEVESVRSWLSSSSSPLLTLPSDTLGLSSLSESARGPACKLLWDNFEPLQECPSFSENQKQPQKNPAKSGQVRERREKGTSQTLALNSMDYFQEELRESPTVAVMRFANPTLRINTS